MVEWVGKEDKNEGEKNDIIITTYDPILTTHQFTQHNPTYASQQLPETTQGF